MKTIVLKMKALSWLPLLVATVASSSWVAFAAGTSSSLSTTYPDVFRYFQAQGIEYSTEAVSLNGEDQPIMCINPILGKSEINTFAQSLSIDLGGTRLCYGNVWGGVAFYDDSLNMITSSMLFLNASISMKKPLLNETLAHERVHALDAFLLRSGKPSILNADLASKNSLNDQLAPVYRSGFRVDEIAAYTRELLYSWQTDYLKSTDMNFRKDVATQYLTGTALTMIKTMAQTLLRVAQEPKKTFQKVETQGNVLRVAMINNDQTEALLLATADSRIYDAVAKNTDSRQTATLITDWEATNRDLLVELANKALNFTAQVTKALNSLYPDPGNEGQIKAFQEQGRLFEAYLETLR